MSSVKTTLDFALPAGAASMYPSEYSAVLTALTDRDHALVETIATAVSEHFGVDTGLVKAQLESIGMAVRPVPTFTPQDSAEWEKELTQPAITEAASVELPKAKKSKKDKTAKLVRKLVKAAQRHGIEL